jgi:CHAD domain-containing protein
MTPQELETPEEVHDVRLSTAALASQLGTKPSAPRNGEPSNEPLFASNQAQELHSQWDSIQGSFVDEPKEAVQRADELVANTIKRLAEVFAAERSKLESAWGKNEDVSTEDLRVALRRYRSFFNRLLSV